VIVDIYVAVKYDIIIIGIPGECWFNQRKVRAAARQGSA